AICCAEPRFQRLVLGKLLWRSHRYLGRQGRVDLRGQLVIALPLIHQEGFEGKRVEPAAGNAAPASRSLGALGQRPRKGDGGLLGQGHLGRQYNKVIPTATTWPRGLPPPAAAGGRRRARPGTRPSAPRPRRWRRGGSRPR